MRFYSVALFFSLVFSCSTAQKTQTFPPPVSKKKTIPVGKVPVYSYEVVNEFEHDKDAFTQGLIFHGGYLYESTGQKGRSTLRKVQLETGKVLQKHKVPRDYFAEGLTVFDGKLYQLSWQDSLGWAYDIADMKLIREFRYSGEGWGLTNDGTNFYLSDGTHVIRVLDPKTFNVLRTISVEQEDGRPLARLNELEFVKGEIWANVWRSENIGKPNHIARINPADGELLGWVNLDKISPKDSGEKYENSLNGIAYDQERDRIFVTGKNWKRLFEIKIRE